MDNAPPFTGRPSNPLASPGEDPLATEGAGASSTLFRVVLPDGRCLGTTALSPIARPLPARMAGRYTRAVAAMLALEWSGEVAA